MGPATVMPGKVLPFGCPQIEHSIYRFGFSWCPLDGMEPHYLDDLIDSFTEPDGVRIDGLHTIPVVRKLVTYLLREPSHDCAHKGQEPGHTVTDSSSICFFTDVLKLR